MSVDRELTGSALLRDAARDVTSWKETSEARARQARWVASEYSRALQRDDYPLDDTATADELLSSPRS